MHAYRQSEVNHVLIQRGVHATDTDTDEDADEQPGNSIEPAVPAAARGCAFLRELLVQQRRAARGMGIRRFHHLGL